MYARNPKRQETKSEPWNNIHDLKSSLDTKCVDAKYTAMLRRCIWYLGKFISLYLWLAFEFRLLCFIALTTKNCLRPNMTRSVLLSRNSIYPSMNISIVSSFHDKTIKNLCRLLLFLYGNRARQILDFVFINNWALYCELIMRLCLHHRDLRLLIGKS